MLQRINNTNPRPYTAKQCFFIERVSQNISFGTMPQPYVKFVQATGMVEVTVRYDGLDRTVRVLKDPPLQ